MSILSGATHTTIYNGTFNVNGVSTAAAGTPAQNDIVGRLHFHSATAGLLDAEERFDAPKCSEGTRTSMILAMKKFVQDGNSSSSPGLYWLYGPAGVGKSALAQSLSLELKSEGDHAASFFFSRTSPGRNNGNRLVVTLAYQLAVNIPALQRFMSKAVRRNPAILSAGNLEQMQSLIIDPINKWRKKYDWSIQRWMDRVNNVNPHPRLVLVDGLDECNDPDVQIDLVLCIASAVRQLSIPLRFVVTSRPEAHILTAFELNPAFQGLNGVTVTRKNLGDDDNADEQIITFLLKEFAEIRRVHPVRKFLPHDWPRPNQIKQLVFKSSKGFIYPATVIRYIRMPHNRPDECLDRILGLSEIPTSDKPYEPLDSLYRHIFESIPEANKVCIHNIFHFLVLPVVSTWEGIARDPTIIERHFHYPPGHVQHVLSDLLCVVEFTSGEHIKILHASLPDFLLDKSRSGPLCVDVSNAHAAIAACYLLIIQRIDNTFLSPSFPGFLDHLQNANMANRLLNDRILQIDLLQRYKQISSSVASRPGRWILEDYLLNAEIRGVAFMIAYLLVLVIRRGPQIYITNQIAGIKDYVLTEYPLAGTFCPSVLSFITPLFHKWKSIVYPVMLNRIFECEVDSSQSELRATVFEIYFLMMATLYRQHIALSANMEYPQNGQTKEGAHYVINIVLGRDYQQTW